MDIGTIFLIVIGAVLLIVLIAVLGGGMAMGGMTMMAGMMATPVGWLILLILVAVIALIGFVLLSQSKGSAGAQAFMILHMQDFLSPSLDNWSWCRWLPRSGRVRISLLVNHRDV